MLHNHLLKVLLQCAIRHSLNTPVVFIFFCGYMLLNSNDHILPVLTHVVVGTSYADTADNHSADDRM
jgi:hypothetical protein